MARKSCQQNEKPEDVYEESREEFKFHSISSSRLPSRFLAFAAHSVLVAAQAALILRG